MHQMHWRFLAAYVDEREHFEWTQRTGRLYRKDFFGAWCAGGEL